MKIGGPKGRDDVLRAIERRIMKNDRSLRRARDNKEELDVEYLRGAISELEIVRKLVEALPVPSKEPTP